MFCILDVQTLSWVWACSLYCITPFPNRGPSAHATCTAKLSPMLHLYILHRRRQTMMHSPAASLSISFLNLNGPCGYSFFHIYFVSSVGRLPFQRKLHCNSDSFTTLYCAGLYLHAISVRSTCTEQQNLTLCLTLLLWVSRLRLDHARHSRNSWHFRLICTNRSAKLKFFR